MSSMWYDRQGRPITLGEWEESFKDPANRIVAQDRIHGFFVSTIHLGINHNFGPDGPPLIFETMVFDHSQPGPFLEEVAGVSMLDPRVRDSIARRAHELVARRYSTEAQALEGHRELLGEIVTMAEVLSIEDHENNDTRP